MKKQENKERKALFVLSKIVKEYILGEQTLRVLKGIDLTVYENEFISIMGQSGSGKSTLMNIIGMLDTPTSWSYHFLGDDVSQLTDNEQSLARRRHIGFIFQSYNLLPKTPAWKQVSLPLSYQGVSKAERRIRAEEALVKVGLGDKIESLPTELSGGQQQRIAVARSLVSNPEIILADEPTGALDSRTWDEIMELLTQLHREGKTIIIITHARGVDKFAQRHIHLKDGEII